MKFYVYLYETVCQAPPGPLAYMYNNIYIFVVHMYVVHMLLSSSVRSSIEHCATHTNVLSFTLCAGR